MAVPPSGGHHRSPRWCARSPATTGPTPSLLVGLAPFDDAAVYKISDDLAIVSTTDFFPPLVDDPADFGAIAAANACSDVFAMGGSVVLALNISAFPERMPVEAIAAILGAAAAVVTEAGGVIGGGHTIRSDEPIFGLAVQGFVHPDHIFRKGGARPGDVLVLSKPIGTGIVLAGGSDVEKAAAIAHMKVLNRAASLRLQERRDVRARCHRRHRLRPARPRLGDGRSVGRDVRVRQRVDAALRRRAAGRGGRNAHRRRRAQPGPPRRARRRRPRDPALEALAYDPQTSGGLLAAVDPVIVGDLVGAGFERVGTVEVGSAAVVLR